MKKRIYITYDEDITPAQACRYASTALITDQRAGVIEFFDNTFLAFKEKAKNITMTIFRGK